MDEEQPAPDDQLRRQGPCPGPHHPALRWHGQPSGGGQPVPGLPGGPVRLCPVDLRPVPALPAGAAVQRHDPAGDGSTLFCQPAVQGGRDGRQCRADHQSGADRLGHHRLCRRRRGHLPVAVQGQVRRRCRRPDPDDVPGDGPGILAPHPREPLPHGRALRFPGLQQHLPGLVAAAGRGDGAHLRHRRAAGGQLHRPGGLQLHGDLLVASHRLSLQEQPRTHLCLHVRNLGGPAGGGAARGGGRAMVVAGRAGLAGFPGHDGPGASSHGRRSPHLHGGHQEASWWWCCGRGGSCRTETCPPPLIVQSPVWQQRFGRQQFRSERFRSQQFQWQQFRPQ